MTPKSLPDTSSSEVPRLQLLYAHLGNAKNTPLPIVDPETGEPMSILRDGQKTLRKLLSDHPQTVALAQRVHDLTGLTLSELSARAVSEGRAREKLVADARRNIALSLEPLQSFSVDVMQRVLAQCGTIQDIILKGDVIIPYFPDRVGDFSQKNEVYACNDAGRLLLMTVDTRFDPRVRYEARRKLILMGMIAEIEMGNKEDEEDQALNRFIDLLNRKIIHLEAGERVGAGAERYLISTHNVKNGHEATSAHIADAPPKKHGHNKKVTPLNMRRAVVEAPDGKTREIFFYINPRDKSTTSSIIKALRYGAPVGERDHDKNGFQMVFEKREDIDDFLRKVEEELKKEGATVSVHKKKDNLNGDGRGFKGHEANHARNNALKVLKFVLVIEKEDEKRQTLEFQIFLPEGLADYQYRNEVNWQEYHVRRFFGDSTDSEGHKVAGVHEHLFPRVIYGLDREKHARELIIRIRRSLWASNGNA